MSKLYYYVIMFEILFRRNMSGVSNIDMMEGETEFPEDILDDDDYSGMPELTESPKKTGVSEVKVRLECVENYEVL